MVKAILGQKLRMTQMFSKDGRRIPITAIQVGPCPITQIKTEESDQYSAIQIGYGAKKEKNTPKPMKGHFAKANVDPLRHVLEIRVDSTEDYSLGQVLDASLFEEGELVDVSGKTKGRGFQGGMRRHGWGGGRATHGSMFHRAIGSIGPGTGIARIFPGKNLPGHMGTNKITIQNLEIMKVDSENSVIFVRGGIPGPNGALVYVKAANKSTKK